MFLILLKNLHARAWENKKNKNMQMIHNMKQKKKKYHKHQKINNVSVMKKKMKIANNKIMKKWTTKKNEKNLLYEIYII